MKEASVKKVINNIIYTLVLLLAATALAFLIFYVSQNNTANIALIYILALLLISLHTASYPYGIFSAFFSVVCINCFFTYPYFAVNFTLAGYPITFIFMLAIAILTSAATIRLKKQDQIIAERERKINESEKERIRANLLRAVSHDLRTPLTSIIGASASYMENHEQLTEKECMDLIATINEDSHWLLNMVENLLSVTRIQNDGGKVAKEPEVIVEEVVSEAITRLKKRIPDASLKVFIPEQVLMIPMDPLLIEQVLINLLENALVHSGSKDPVELSVTEEKDTVTFHVIDHGKGIDINILPDILSGQYKKPSTSDAHRGMGIGLSICNTIIQAHGGTIAARNHESGAEFYFTLPKEDNQ
nr:DUF4118 domain-containing protein [uncultured Merdimonas sp.]